LTGIDLASLVPNTRPKGGFMESSSWQQETKKDERGRNASSPTEITARGWRDTLIRVKEETVQDRLSLISAAMAFYGFLALVPALTSVVLIYAWISDPGDISQHLAQAQHIMPAEVSSILESQLSSLAGQANASLGLGAIMSLLIALWSASRANATAMEAFNVIYEERDQRGFIKRNSIAVALALLGAVLALVAIGVIVGVPVISNFMNLDGPLQFAVTAISWVVLLGLFAFYLATNYRYGPDRKKAQWKWVSSGSIIAAILWVVASALFSFYVSSFGNFNETYGSFGAIVVLMFWFYISAFVILLGAEINAESEHQTTKDSTIDEPGKPMGQRGARMADTVGEEKANWH
jgi:membrane protein